VGTFSTTHTVHLAEEAAKAGADGLLVVTPYYSKPPQAGLLAHFRTVADATDLPILLYDIPGRTATPIATPTMIVLAAHPNIVGVKDAKGDLTATSKVLAETALAYYSGDDALTLPLLSVAAVGVVGTSTHFSGVGTKAMIEAFARGDTAEARRWHHTLLPIFTGVFATQGCILVKAGLAPAACPSRRPAAAGGRHRGRDRRAGRGPDGRGTLRPARLGALIRSVPSGEGEVMPVEGERLVAAIGVSRP
jgi:4-hydroxy-tetrahydrodipicolinate synthase